MSASTHTALMEKPVPARSAGDNAAATTVESTSRRGGAAAICNEFTFGDEALPKEDAEAVAKKLSAHRPCNFSVKPEAVCATSSLLSEPALHLANEMSGASAHESQTRDDGKDLVRKHRRTVHGHVGDGPPRSGGGIVSERKRVRGCVGASVRRCVGASSTPPQGRLKTDQEHTQRRFARAGAFDVTDRDRPPYRPGRGRLATWRSASK